MADEGYANLYHGGGGCDPHYLRHEDYFDPEKKQSKNMSGFGTKPTYDFIPKWDPGQYPQPDIEHEKPGPTSLECVKGGGTFALSRELSFSDPYKSHNKFRLAGDSAQPELWRWMLRNKEDIVAGYCLNLVIVPMCIEAECIYLRTASPVEGLTFDVIEFFTETVIAAGVDLGAPVTEAVDACRPWCTKFDIPAELKFSPDCNRVFGIKLTGVPPENEDECKPGCGLLEGLDLDFSVKAFCPWAGQ